MRQYSLWEMLLGILIILIVFGGGYYLIDRFLKRIENKTKGIIIKNYRFKQLNEERVYYGIRTKEGD